MFERLGILIPGRSLPEMVFTPRWTSFYLFEADHMFSGDFVEVVQLLSSGASEAKLALLDAREDSSSEEILIRRDCKAEDYERSLKGKDASDGLLYWMADYCCYASGDSWFIYCERANEVAVLAFENGCNGPSQQDALIKLKALPAEVMLCGLNMQFPFNDLTKAWHDGLIQNYS